MRIWTFVSMGKYLSKSARKILKFKSSQPRCSVKKGFLKNFANFTGKHLCWSIISIKLQAWGLQLYLKKETPTQVLSCETCVKFLRTLILKSICDRLLLKIPWMLFWCLHRSVSTSYTTDAICSIRHHVLF